MIFKEILQKKFVTLQQIFHTERILYFIMNNKDFISALSEECGLSANQVSSAVESLISVITQNLKNMDSVAIPGFGKFDAIKEDEKISKDLSTGKRLLLPPVINVVFTPASAFIKIFEK